jgi:hypothetical protein
MNAFNFFPVCSTVFFHIIPAEATRHNTRRRTCEFGVAVMNRRIHRHQVSLRRRLSKEHDLLIFIVARMKVLS